MLLTSTRRPRAVVTGASSGIGAAIADKLLSDGWKVCLIARRRQEMQEISRRHEESLSFIITCDLNDESATMRACESIVEWCGESDPYLNLLINNAGFLDVNEEIEVKPPKSISQSVANWNKHINVLLKAPVIFTKYMVPLLASASANPVLFRDGAYDGSIINISSVASAELVSPPISPYCTCKAALNMLTKLSAKELSAKYAIRCNAIKFGGVDTQIPFKGGWSEAGWRGLVETQPIGRIGSFNDSNQIMLFLADRKKSGFVTGACLNIDGGFGCVGGTGNEYGRKRENPSQSKL